MSRLKHPLSNFLIINDVLMLMWVQASSKPAHRKCSHAYQSLKILNHGRSLYTVFLTGKKRPWNCFLLVLNSDNDPFDLSVCSFGVVTSQ